MKKKISITIACYNEEGNINLMYNAVTEQIQKLPQYKYEILFEDNASTDKSQDILKELAQNDKHVKVILNQYNCGPMRSGTNCLNNASGDAYISIPCDFQEPPNLIPEFVKYWELGYDIVWGQKIKSEENALKYVFREIYYKVINNFSDYPQLKQTTGFGIMDKKVVDTIMITKLQDPLIATRHLIMEYGFKIKLIPYTQQKRKYGKSSYNVFRYLDFSILSFCNTSTTPLRMMTVLGIVTAITSLIFGIIYFIYKLTHWHTFSAGVAPIVIGLFFCASVQLFCIGILGEYIGIILRKVTKKPIVVEKERINFDDE